MTEAEFLRLLDEVRRRSTHRDSSLHGEPHWRAVAWTAIELAPLVPGCDLVVGFFFGLLHDTMRLNDGQDPDHGLRACQFAQDLAHEGLLNLEPARLATLTTAIERHTGASPTTDPTLGLCWDADRLNLWRVGVRPQAQHLSTAPARERERILAHRFLPGQHASWREMFEQVAGNAASEKAH